MANVMMEVICISEELCKNCDALDPAVFKDNLFTMDECFTQNQIYCKNYRKCQKMYDYILRSEKKRTNDEQGT